jgi:hypothetical protein
MIIYNEMILFKEKRANRRKILRRALGEITFINVAENTIAFAEVQLHSGIKSGVCTRGRAIRG